MEKPFEYAKSMVQTYKLDYCCWIAPVRVGLMFVGYFNIIVALVSLIGTANESFPPTIVKVQEMILEDNATKPIPLLVYATELGFSVLLLCAVYRKDLVLMRAYMIYCVGAIILSLLVYSIVIAAIDVLVQIAIILSTVFQFYILLLVRSAMVEIKMENKNYELPTLVMSSLVKDKETPSSTNAEYTNNGQTQEEKFPEVKVNQDKEVKTQEETPIQDVKITVEKKEPEMKKNEVIKTEIEVKKNKGVRKIIELKKKKDTEKVEPKNVVEQKNESKETKLETVNEHPKE